MLSFKDFLCERYMTIHPDKYDSKDEYEKAKHDFIKDHWHHIEKSYEKVGGFAGAASPEELANDLHMIKGVKRDGKVVGFLGYRDKHGRKVSVAATDGSDAGKKAYRDISAEDNKMTDRHAWAEKSGKPAEIADKMNTPKVSSDHAERLTGKKILKKHEDGHSYDRVIGGEVHTKKIYGNPKLD